MKKLPFHPLLAKKLVPVYGALALLLSGCNGDSGSSAVVADTVTEATLPDGRYISWKEHTIDGEGKSDGIRLRGAQLLQVADFDQDGHLDIVSAYRESSHIRIAFGSDDPGEWFRLSLAEGAEAGGVADAAVADLNTDGFPDLVAACEKGIFFTSRTREERFGAGAGHGSYPISRPAARSSASRSPILTVTAGLRSLPRTDTVRPATTLPWKLTRKGPSRGLRFQKTPSLPLGAKTYC